MAVVQVGTIAYRDENGDFLPSCPIMQDDPEIIEDDDNFIPNDLVILPRILEAFDKYEKARLANEERHKERMKKLKGCEM